MLCMHAQALIANVLSLFVVQACNMRRQARIAEIQFQSLPVSGVVR